MSFADDQVLAKLSALNESHDSIATAAQWIMFHRRHAERTVQIWLQKLKDSPSVKRLNLVYLANEVVQQSKARRKDDFMTAFSPVIAEAMAAAYRGASPDIQNKLRRVVDVWRERNIFETPIQAAVEARIEELDKNRGGASKASFGSGPSFGGASSVPAELTPLAAPQLAVSKLTLPAKTSSITASQDYEKLADPSTPVPSAPVYAARLNGLLKTLANAEGAVAECVKARRELIGALEKLLDTNKAALAGDMKELETLQRRKATIDGKKQDVELAIMSGLATDGGGGGGGEQPQGNGAAPASPQPEVEVERPEVEALTPPAMEGGESDFYDNSPAAKAKSSSPVVPEQASLPSLSPLVAAGSGAKTQPGLVAQYQSQSIPVSLNGSHKRRRVDSAEDFLDLGNDDGIDADVAEMLRKDSASS